MMLIPTVPTDLPLLFDIQADEVSIHQAAFTAPDPYDREAYLLKWTSVLQREGVHMQSVWVDGVLIGSIIKFEMEGAAELAYGFDRAYWGKGLATEAVSHFLKLEVQRPMHARIAFDNTRSARVLEKCGFVKTHTEQGFANARNAEIEEFVYILR